MFFFIEQEHNVMTVKFQWNIIEAILQAVPQDWQLGETTGWNSLNLYCYKIFLNFSSNFSNFILSLLTFPGKVKPSLSTSLYLLKFLLILIVTSIVTL
jgi:hypothetical protein